MAGSAAPAGPRGMSLDHVLKSQQDLNTPYVDRRSTGGFQGLTAGAADPDVRVEILIAARIPPALTSKAGGSWLKA